jgi:hypothetical protein
VRTDGAQQSISMKKELIFRLLPDNPELQFEKMKVLRALGEGQFFIRRYTFVAPWGWMGKANRKNLM